MSHSDVELSDPANVGVDEIVEKLRPIAIKHGVSFGDLYVAICTHLHTSYSPSSIQHPIRRRRRRVQLRRRTTP